MRMRFIFATIFLALTSQLFAQSDYKIYEWEELKQCDPDTVYGISFRKNKLDSVPFDLIRFQNVRYLDFEKNKLTDIPLFIQQFQELEHLNLGKNELVNFPLSLCRLTKLNTLLLHMNEISYLPQCVEQMVGLKTLDLFKNPIRKLPDELASLQSLETLEMRSIKFSPEFQEKWIGLLPNTKIMFDPPCDCMK